MCKELPGSNDADADLVNGSELPPEKKLFAPGNAPAIKLLTDRKYKPEVCAEGLKKLDPVTGRVESNKFASKAGNDVPWDRRDPPNPASGVDGLS